MPSQKESKPDDTWVGKNGKKAVAGAGVTLASGSVATLVIWYAEDVEKIEGIHAEEGAAIAVIFIVLVNGLLRIYGDWIAPILKAFHGRIIRKIEGLNGRK